MKSRPYLINYHHNDYSNTFPHLNNCWGNSSHELVNAPDIIAAIKKFIKKMGKDKYIYSIEGYNPTIELDYYTTQKLLKMEGFIVDKVFTEE